MFCNYFKNYLHIWAHQKSRSKRQNMIINSNDDDDDDGDGHDDGGDDDGHDGDDDDDEEELRESSVGMFESRLLGFLLHSLLLSLSSQ